MNYLLYLNESKKLIKQPLYLYTADGSSGRQINNNDHILIDGCYYCNIATRGFVIGALINNKLIDFPITSLSPAEKYYNKYQQVVDFQMFTADDFRSENEYFQFVYVPPTTVGDDKEQQMIDALALLHEDIQSLIIVNENIRDRTHDDLTTLRLELVSKLERLIDK